MQSENAHAKPSWTYWVVPGRFLAGCFPGGHGEDEHRRRLGQLLDAGIRRFISLMEEDETSFGTPFPDYTLPVGELARERGVEVGCVRLPVRDMDVPTEAEMESFIETIDRQMEEGPVYLHCWGGLGRTGTVVACWLLSHGLASGDTVLDRLKELRQADEERGQRDSPQTGSQRRFVSRWAERSRSEGRRSSTEGRT